MAADQILLTESRFKCHPVPLDPPVHNCNIHSIWMLAVPDLPAGQPKNPAW